jgi:hypothetical protein
MKAQILLEQINTVRHLRGLPAIEELHVPTERGSPLDAAEQATGLRIAWDQRTRKYFFDCETAALARKVGEALGQQFDENTFAVPLPREIHDFVIASWFDPGSLGPTRPCVVGLIQPTEIPPFGSSTSCPASLIRPATNHQPRPDNPDRGLSAWRRSGPGTCGFAGK